MRGNRRKKGTARLLRFYKRLKYADASLITVSFLLLSAGLLFLYSASAVYSSVFIRKQIIWTIMGTAAMFFGLYLNYEKLRKYSGYLMAGTGILLIVTLFCPPIANVRRWIPLGFFNLQTSEIAKIAVVFFLSDYLDKNIGKIMSNHKRLIKPMLCSGIILFLIAMQPDLGTPSIIFANIVLILFLAGIRPRYILAPIAAMVPLFILEILRHPYRLERLKIYLSPWSDASRSGYQIVQSILAVGSGGWFGKGFGASRLKLMYIPEPHTDFIFPIIAEEIGFIGSTVIAAFFLYFLSRGLAASKNARNLFSSLLAAGLTLNIVIQAFFNMAMATGLIPTKGLPLPFFSYGGSLMIATMFQLGLILNISIKRR